MTQLTVAFATIRHAQAARSFVAGASFEVRSSAPECGGDADYARVEFLVARAHVRRLRTLLAGVHGIVIEERTAADHAVA